MQLVYTIHINQRLSQSTTQIYVGNNNPHMYTKGQIMYKSIATKSQLSTGSELQKIILSWLGWYTACQQKKNFLQFTFSIQFTFSHN